MLDAGPAAAASSGAATAPLGTSGDLPPLADDVPTPTAMAPPTRPLGEADPLGQAQPSSSADSLDALSLARGMAQEQLRRPERVVQVLVVTALLAYRLGRAAGRRSGRREARRWMNASLG